MLTLACKILLAKVERKKSDVTTNSIFLDICKSYCVKHNFLMFKLRQGASKNRFVGRMVCLLVSRSVGPSLRKILMLVKDYIMHNLRIKT